MSSELLHTPASGALQRSSTAGECSSSRASAGRSPTPPAAMRRWGGLEGFTPPHRFKARTTVSDGHCAIPRAARSAGLRFAVRSLSEAIDRETIKSGARVGTSSTAAAVPLPLNRGRLKRCRNWSETSNVGQHSNALLAAMLEDPLQLCYLVSGLWSLYSTPNHLSPSRPDFSVMIEKEYYIGEE